MPDTTLSSLFDTLKALSRMEGDWVDSKKIFGSEKASFAYGNCILLYYWGFIDRIKKGGSWIWRINNDGIHFMRNLSSSDFDYRPELRKRMLKLESFKTLLRFLKQEVVFDAHLAQKTLGSIMNSFGVRLADVGVAKKGGKGTMMKPYNPAIFPVLLRLVENVGLISMKKNRVELLPLTKDEEKLIDEIKYDYFLWTNHRERLILASLLDVLYQQNVTDIVCPYIEREVLEVLDRMTLLRDKEIRVITRSTETIHGRERPVKKTIDALKFLEEKGCKFEARENRESPIHAKLATSNSCALVSSSNLTLTSLKRNYEIGMAFFAAERIVEVERMFENIWCDPQTKEIPL